MSAIHTSVARRFCLRFALPVVTICTFSTAARADDQAMRSVYPDFSSSGKSTAQNSPSKIPNSYAPAVSPRYSRPGGMNGAVSPATRPPIESGRLPSAMPNPAAIQPTQSGETAQQAEHQRVLQNMRRAGYSQARINAMDPYIHQSDPPGTTYRMVNGIKMRNDGMTFDQAFHNVTHNGLMDTPIHADPNYYAPGTYGYYKTHGGTKTYGQWLDDGQR